MKNLISLFILLSATAHGAKVDWKPWNAETWQQAKKEKKLVILDLEAVWCHWCHVMDEKTYQDPKVVALLSKHFISIKVDQDSRPDLSNRYEDYGWPATIFFDSNGKELVKRRGYIDPVNMISLLEAIIADPTPGPSVGPEIKIKAVEVSSLTPQQKKNLRDEYIKMYDVKKGGWGTVHKFLQIEKAEYALQSALKGDKGDENRLKETLRLSAKLIDPAWGGMYQYSVGDWNTPHFEKIMSTQTDSLRVYSLSFAAWKDMAHLRAAKSIARYLKDFLMSPEGTFYTSQDADLKKGEHSEGFFKLSDKERRKLGIPHIDKNVYARENGWAIGALAQLYMATGDNLYLSQAVTAAEVIEAQFQQGPQTYRHSMKDFAPQFLGDTLAMGRAWLALYQATADRTYLRKAQLSADAIDNHFTHPVAGYGSSLPEKGASFAPHPNGTENFQLCRFANHLYHFTGDKKYRVISERALRYLLSPEVIDRSSPAAILIADYEFNQPPAHITVVGRKNDPAAKALFKSANQYKESYKRVDWWDKREGVLPNSTVKYPQLSKAAAFACSQNRCSLPIYKAEELGAKLEALNKLDDQSVTLKP